MAHLRSFLENLHQAAFPLLQAKFAGDIPKKWGEGVEYLGKNEVLSVPEKLFVIDLYRLISDEGVHPLVAEGEYARLFRNVVIEYALLFLKKLNRLGIKRA